MELWQLSWTARYILRSLRQREITKAITSPVAWRKFWNDYAALSSQKLSTFSPSREHMYPCLGDDSATTPIEPIYYYQDTWAFGRIVARKPASHVDIGSHHKYVGLLSRVLPVTMVDIRPPDVPLEGLNFREGTITNLPFEDGSVSSVSSLCVVEHIGLGRYGDPLDPRGSEKALAELKRVVAPGGRLLISVPIDDGNLVFFNAHRAFAEEYLLSLLAPMKLIEARYIYGKEFTSTRRGGHGVGCYELEKPAS
jgi:SAM-dependent methyltransferase